VREGEQGQSTADFYAKFCIAQKEANETDYWLDILHATGYINESTFQDFDKDCKEIFSILTAILRTTYNNK